jgi:hypothetical protein
MIRDALLALGLLVDSRPIACRACLSPRSDPARFAWVEFSTRRTNQQPAVTPALATAAFPLVFALARNIGLGIGLATEEFRDTDQVHDMLAYLLVAAVSSWSSCCRTERRLQIAWMWLRPVRSVFCSSGRGPGTVRIPGIEPVERLEHPRLVWPQPVRLAVPAL